MAWEFLTERGRHPEFADRYGARTEPGLTYPVRTWWNVRDSDATLWFGNPFSRGGVATLHAVTARPRHALKVINPHDDKYADHPRRVAQWLVDHNVRILNCAGNRESLAPGIGAWVEGFLITTFTTLRTLEAAADGT